MGDADRLAILERAMARIYAAIPKYVHQDPQMTVKEFADEVLSAVDNKDVFRVMKGAVDASPER